LFGLEGGVVDFRVRQVQGGFILVVEKREQLVIFLLTDRIVFVIVALGTPDRESQKGGAGGCQPIHDRLDPELFPVDPALLVDLGVSVETGGDFFLVARIGEHVASELLDHELVEGKVAVDRVDHPVPIEPDVPRCVDAVSVRIGIPRDVQPPAGPAFSVPWRFKQSLNEPGIRVGARIVHECLHRLDRRRQSGEVE
jgi:hypothetical protein